MNRALMYLDGETLRLHDERGRWSTNLPQPCFTFAPWSRDGAGGPALSSALHLESGGTSLVIGCRRCHLPDPSYTAAATATCDYTMDYSDFAELVETLARLRTRRALTAATCSNPYRERARAPQATGSCDYVALLHEGDRAELITSHATAPAVMSASAAIAIGWSLPALVAPALLMACVGVPVYLWWLVRQRPPRDRERTPLPPARTPYMILGPRELILEFPGRTRIRHQIPRGELEFTTRDDDPAGLELLVTLEGPGLAPILLVGPRPEKTLRTSPRGRPPRPQRVFGLDGPAMHHLLAYLGLGEPARAGRERIRVHSLAAGA